MTVIACGDAFVTSVAGMKGNGKNTKEPRPNLMAAAEAVRKGRNASLLHPLCLAVLSCTTHRGELRRELLLLRARWLRLRLGLRRRDSNDGAAREHVCCGAASVHIRTVNSIGITRSRKNRGVVRHGTVVARAERDLATRGVRRRHLPVVVCTATGIEGLNLGLNAAAIGCCADARKARANRLDQTVLHERCGIVEGRLNDIVGERVAEQALHLAGGQKLQHDHIPRLVGRATQALLDHVGAELVLGEGNDAALELVNDGLREGLLVEIDDVLDHVVAERVLHEGDGMGRDAFNEPHLLRAIGMVDATLQHATAVTVSSHLNAVLADSVKDERGVSRAELIEALLNDMVAVEVLDQLDDLVPKGLNNQIDLNRRGHMLDHLLEGSSTMLVQCDSHHVRGRILDQDGALVVAAVLNQLLAEIVSEGVRHQLHHVLVGFEPDHVDLLRDAVLQLLLQVAASVLVLAQGVNAATNLLERQVVEPGHCCRGKLAPIMHLRGLRGGVGLD